MNIIYLLPPAIIVWTFIMFWKQKPKDKPKPNNELYQMAHNAGIEPDELLHLQHQIQARNATNNLTEIENQVLDIYEQSGIRIPVDIIEDMANMRFNTIDEAFKYVETQRYFWKLENTKKPYRMK